jgi:hypothetical protein
MGAAVWLNCTGLDDLDVKTHSEVVVRVRQVLEPLCNDADNTLTITKGDHRGDLNLNFDRCRHWARNCAPLGNRHARRGCRWSVFMLAHQDLRVCGQWTKTRTRDAPLPERVPGCSARHFQHRPA